MATISFKQSSLERLLFSDTRAAIFWLLVRLYVGWAWLSAGFGKITSSAWTGDSAGSALTGFVQKALTKTAGDHPDVTGWYAGFLESVILPNTEIWGPVIAWGEFFVGIALILGLFTGIAAFFGLFMNLNFMLAGTLSSNPILFTLAIGLILSWKIAGYIGLDRWVLPLLGTSWQPGKIFKDSSGN
jgi:thiosulfate dehydrogenase [quinone] large subunit